MAFLKHNGLQRSDQVLEIGCGVMRGGAPIVQYLNNSCYFGLEVNTTRLEEGRKELAENCLTVRMPQLFSTWDALAGVVGNGSVNVAWAFQVVIHMSDDIASATMRHVAPLLKRGERPGRFFFTAQTNTTGKMPLPRFHQDKQRWKEFPAVDRSFAFYKQLAHKNGLRLRVVPYGELDTNMLSALDRSDVLVAEPI
uniref:Small RNA 2'-O-methyltransferase n=1 Tax=Haptolina brevifila TaxID=156173 RepID=A0A7S2J208_9EUKA